MRVNSGPIGLRWQPVSFDFVRAQCRVSAHRFIADELWRRTDDELNYRLLTEIDALVFADLCAYVHASAMRYK